MTALAVTNTFVSLASITAAGHNTNFSDIVVYINNRNSGSVKWDCLYATNASAVPLVVDNSSGSVDIANFKDNGSTVFSIVNGGAAQFSTGTNAAPSISFLADSDSGFHSGGDGAIEVTLNAVDTIEFAVASVRPVADNTISLGITGKRWTEVWATNGTIQTSHSSTKTDIAEISVAELGIPKAITYKRPGNDTKTYLGFEADNLPPEAFAEDGVSVYTGSVIGVLCSHVKDLADRVAALEAK